jgi:hypothetical protein
MKNDDFIATMANDWRAKSVEPADIARRYRRTRHRTLVLTATAVIGLVLLLAGFAVLLRTTVGNSQALLAIAILAFAFALPIGLVDLIHLRKALRLDFLGTLESLVAQTRVQIAVRQRLQRSGMWAAIILAIAAAVAALSALAGLAPVAVALPLAALWGATALAVALWQHRAARHLALESAIFDETVPGLLADQPE